MSNKNLIKKEIWVEMLGLWPFFEAPTRPSKLDLKIWERELGQQLHEKRKINVLILGATPEIRDLFAKHHVAVNLIDVSPNMVNGLAKLMKYKKRRKEEVFIDNWLNIKKIFPANRFDLVLGHSFLNNIPWKFYPNLLRAIRMVLKKDGHLLIVTPTLGNFKKISVGGVVRLYQKNPNFFKSFANRWHILDVLKRLDYNPRTKQVFFGKVKARLVTEIARQNLPPGIINKIWTFGASNLVDNYVGTHPPFNEVLSVIKKYFIIDGVIYDKPIGYRAHPNFVLKPKK